jgi:hypothetical protein
MTSDKPRPYLNSPDAPPQPEDEREGLWPRKRLLRMDQRFRQRMERVLRQGAKQPGAPPPPQPNGAGREHASLSSDRRRQPLTAVGRLKGSRL